MEIVVALFLTMVTVALVAIRLAPQMADGRIVYGHEPDRPHPFGYRMAWLAIRTRDTGAVIEQLGLVDPQVANWSSGLGSIYDATLGENHIYVSPPVNGWTLVAGHALPNPTSRRFIDKSIPLMLDLSTRFVEVQYFASYPQIDFFAWARVIEGRMIRAFAINDAGVVWNKGRATKEEKAMGLKLFEVRGVRGRKGDAGDEIVLYPTETHMMQLALKWSLDPTRFDPAQGEAGLGVIGKAPAAWRPERLVKAA